MRALRVVCNYWSDPGASMLLRDVPADGGSFSCDFSGLADIRGGFNGEAGYLEPDGDMVTSGYAGPYVEVFYGAGNSAGAIYAPGHTFTITVTSSAGAFKATTAVSTTVEGGFWGNGFRPAWNGGDCCNWTPAEPDIQPGDRVYYASDDGYTNVVTVGRIYSRLDLGNDTATGPIYARWFTEPLQVSCQPNTMYPWVHRYSSAKPDGSSYYYCDWQDTSGGQEAWDMQPADMVLVRYYEPDYDQVVRVMWGSEGAPPPMLYIPVSMK